MNCLCSAPSKWNRRPNRHWGRVVLLLLSLSALIFSKSPALGVLLFKESFDYPASQSINNQNGGTGFTTETDVGWNKRAPQIFSDQISNTGLNFQNLTTTGNALLAHIAGGDDNDTHQSIRYINPVSLSGDSSYWFSFLMKLDSIPEGTSISNFSGYVALMPIGVGQTLRAGIFSKSSNISIASNSQTSPKYSATDSISIGQTYFVVLHIEGNSAVTLYINPTPGIESPSDLSEAGSGTLTISAQFARLGVFSSGVGAEWMFDEFRFGTTYLDVAPIPEPSNVILLALGGLLILFCHRQLQKLRLQSH